MTATFSNVDSSGDPDAAADCQDQVDTWPSVVACKTKIYEFWVRRAAFSMWASARATISQRSGPTGLSASIPHR